MPDWPPVGHSRFRERVSGFLHQNSLFLAHEDPSEMLVSLSEIHVHLIGLDGDDDGLLCIAEILDESTRSELTSTVCSGRPLKNFLAHQKTSISLSAASPLN